MAVPHYPWRAQLHAVEPGGGSPLLGHSEASILQIGQLNPVCSVQYPVSSVVQVKFLDEYREETGPVKIGAVNKKTINCLELQEELPLESVLSPTSTSLSLFLCSTTSRAARRVFARLPPLEDKRSLQRGWIDAGTP